MLLMTVVLLPVVLFLLFRAWQHLPGQARSGPDTPAATPPATAQAAPPDRTVRAATTARAPLPPADAPITDIATSLQARADAGDSLAACRLGMELLRCQQVPDEFAEHHFQELERQEKHHRDEGDTQRAERIAAGRRAQRDLLAACRGIPQATRDRAHHYLRLAALAGEPDAQLRYASGESLGLMGRFDRLTSPEVDAWRREAPALLARALAAGRPEAVQLLAEAYRPGDEATTTIVGWVIPNDPVQAHAYSLLQRQLSGGISPPGQRPAAGLDDAGRARAQALAEDLRQRHFDGVVVDPERVVLGLPPLTDPFALSKHAAVADRFCQSDAAGDAP
ncbi:hypothetical protein [Arenimonas terrae]|nr:hypothetical protein [Arenimonas terrae]